MSTAAGCVFIYSINPLLTPPLSPSAPSNGASAGVKSPKSKDKGKGKGKRVTSPDVSMEEDEDEEDEEDDDDDDDDEMEEDVRDALHRLSLYTQRPSANLACLGRRRRRRRGGPRD
jgi:hypothetical protein